MQTKTIWIAAGLTLLAAGCYGPMARVTPAQADGVRVSLAGGGCVEARPATTETPEEAGHLYARISIENHGERALTFDSRDTRFIDQHGERNPWMMQRRHVIAPHGTQDVDMRVSSHGIQCSREMAVAFGDSFTVDGKPVQISTLRFLPSHDQRMTLAER
jgi:hypothetical protein